MAKLTDQQTGEVLNLGESEHSIGRRSDNDIQLADDSVSRHHAKFHRTANGWVLEDLGSSRGSFVNDKRIGKATAVKEGDTVRFGGVTFGFAEETKQVISTSGTTRQSEAGRARPKKMRVLTASVGMVILVGLVGRVLFSPATTQERDGKPKTVSGEPRQAQEEPQAVLGKTEEQGSLTEEERLEEEQRATLRELREQSSETEELRQIALRMKKEREERNAPKKLLISNALALKKGEDDREGIVLFNQISAWEKDEFLKDREFTKQGVAFKGIFTGQLDKTAAEFTYCQIEDCSYNFKIGSLLLFLAPQYNSTYHTQVGMAIPMKPERARQLKEQFKQKELTVRTAFAIKTYKKNFENYEYYGAKFKRTILEIIASPLSIEFE